MPSPAAADDGGCRGGGQAQLEVAIIFEDDGTETKCLDWQQLSVNPDVTADYTLRTGDDYKGQPVQNGTSIGAVLSLAGVTPAAVTYASVSGVGGTKSTLTQKTRDFVDADDADFPFEDGPPVFYTEDGGDSIFFIKPLHKGDKNDVNGAGQMVGKGGVLRLTVNLIGDLLHPELSVTKSAGRDITYKLTVPDKSNPRETLKATIDFRDDRTDLKPLGYSKELDGTHVFPPGAGTYYVYVTVTGDRGSSGVSNVVQVKVSLGSVPTKSASDPATSGPSHGAGNRDEPLNGPVTGTGPKLGGNPTDDPTGHPGAGGVHRPGRDAVTRSSGSVGSRQTAPVGPSGAESSPTTSGGPGMPTPAGVRVAGYALPAPGAVEQENGGRRPAAPAARSSVTHAAFPTWGVVSAAVVIGLGLAGAVSERRRPSRRPRRATQ